MRIFGWGSLRRNWLVAVVGLIVSVALAGASVVLLPVSYGATSQLVLLPPLNQQNASYNGVVNPYMGLDGLESMASVVASAMMDDQTAKTLHQEGVSSYSVQYNTLSAGPVLVAQVSEPTPQKASAAIAVLDNQVPLTVARLQNDDSIAAKSFIAAKVISSPTVPAQSVKNELRAAILVLVVGLVLTLFATSVIDAWRIRRQDSAVDGPRETGKVEGPSSDSYDRQSGTLQTTTPDNTSVRTRVNEPTFTAGPNSRVVPSDRVR